MHIVSSLLRKAISQMHYYFLWTLFLNSWYRAALINLFVKVLITKIGNAYINKCNCNKTFSGKFKIWCKIFESQDHAKKNNENVKKMWRCQEDVKKNNECKILNIKMFTLFFSVLRHFQLLLNKLISIWYCVIERSYFKIKTK